MDYDEEFKLDKHLALLREKARVAFKDGRCALTVELLTPYLRHRPNDDFAWLRLGQSLEQIGLFLEAEQALLRADEFDANRLHSLAALANLYKKLGQYELADSLYAKAVDHPDSCQKGWIWIQRGGNFARWNHLEDAEKCYRKALELSDTDYDEAWLNIGLVLRA